MSTTAPSQPRNPAFAKPREPEKLEVSAQDQASSMVIALLFVLGMIVLIMFAIWLSSRLNYLPPPVPVTILDDLGGGGSGNNTPGAEQQLEEVSPEEVKDLQEVNVEMQSVVDAVSTQAVNLEAVEAGASGLGSGEGPGTGDGRGPGP